MAARLAGASLNQVARAYGVSERHVRRIMAEYREGHLVAAPAALKLADEACGEMARQLQELRELSASTDDLEKRLQFSERFVSPLGAQIAVLRNAGMVSPEAYAGAQKVDAAVEAARFDWTSAVNLRIRKLLEDREVAPGLIEEVVDQVMIGAEA